MPTSYNAWISFTLIPSFSPEAEPHWLLTCKPNLLHLCQPLAVIIFKAKIINCYTAQFARPLVITLCLWQQMWQRYDINLASEAVISPVLFLWSRHLFFTQWRVYMTSAVHIRVWLSLEKYVSLQHFVFDKLRSDYDDLAVCCDCWPRFRDIFNDVTGDSCTRSCNLWKSSLSLRQISVIQLSGDLHRHREDGLSEPDVSKCILVFGLYVCLKSERQTLGCFHTCID